MAERFSAVMDSRLIEMFTDKLREVLMAAGFVETLRLSGSHLSEYQRDSDVITVHWQDSPGHHRQTLVVESESVDVSPLVDLAGQALVADVLGQIPRQPASS